MQTKLTAKQIQDYFPYMENNLSSEYMSAILLGQKTFNVGNGLIQIWVMTKTK